jgi:ubiquinone/menaquinone biosynthesis C-methylase UbiE
VDRADPAYAGQAFYTRGSLVLYDAFAYGFNSTILWRCPKSRLVELYDANVSARHLDIGVATGRLLDECRFPVPAPEITLMDLNPNSLAAAAGRLARFAPRTHQANVLEPWGLPAAAFDSVAMSHLLHCIPGTMPEKAVVFEHAKAVLAPGGRLFGATIFGKGVELSPPARAMTAVSNRRGILSNLGDGPEGLDAALGRAFPSHELSIRGAVGLFTARVPPLPT